MAGLMALEPDIQSALSAFRDGVRAALAAKLIAIYVNGSLTMGDFEPASSDLDFLVVVREPLTLDEISRLEGLHRRLADESTWGARLEGEYPVQAQLRPAGIEGPAVTVEPGEGLLPDVVNQFTAENVVAIREYGVTLYGPPPSEVLPLVDRATLDLALRDYLLDLAARPSGEDLASEELASDVLNLARCAFGLGEGRPCTKIEAAQWLGIREPTLRTILEAALAVRRGETSPDAGRVLGARFGELARVV